MAFALLVLAGCQRSPKEQVLARVNGEPVTAELFAQYVKTRLHRDVATLDPAAREQALHALLELEAAGGGFAAELLELMAAGVPLLTVVSPRFQDDWRRYTGGASLLPADDDAVRAWIDRVVAARAGTP